MSAKCAAPVLPSHDMPPRIRVVRIFSRLNIGGPSIHVLLLTAGLNPRRFDSTLIVGSEGPAEGTMFDLADHYGVTPVKLGPLGREISPLQDLRATLQLWRFLRRHRPLVVHTHTSKAGFSGRLAALLAGIPVVVHTFHGHVFKGYFGPVKTRLILALERFLAHNTDAVVTISEKLKEELVSLRVAPAHRVRVIRLGLDLDDFLALSARSGALRTSVGASEGDFVVGIVGRLVPVKDHWTFLRAAALACAGSASLRFAVIGDGPLRQELELFARQSGAGDRVRFTGWRRDLPQVYADLDAVVISSRNEGTPVSIIEGAAAGKPVVATRVGGIPDMIDDGRDGLMVPPGNPQALADAMLRLVQEPGLRETLGAAARERAAREYSALRLLSEVEKLYLELLESKSGTSTDRA
jgi:glycosyltransferase involved in cell wall biosynthesis